MSYFEKVKIQGWNGAAWVDITSDLATQTTLNSVKTAVESINGTGGVKKITDALPAGTNLMGKVGIDQVTANANEVVVKSGIITATIGANSTVDVNKIAGTTTDVNNGAVSAGTQRVTIANNSTGVVGLNSGTNIIGKAGIDQTTPGTTDAVTIKATNGTNPQLVRCDTSTRSLITIDYAHHEIHDGDSFSAHHSATGKNDGDTINIYIKTPDTAKYFHMFFNWSSGGAAYGRIFEGPTITAATGTNGQTIFNRNRTSSNTSGAYDNANPAVINKFGYDVTKTVDGLIISEEYSGAAKSHGAFVRADKEIVLAKNTVYLFQVESDAANITLDMDLSWYEHTDLAA